MTTRARSRILVEKSFSLMSDTLDLPDYSHLSLDEIKALQLHLEKTIAKRARREIADDAMLPASRHVSLSAALESLVTSYREFRHFLVFGRDRMLDKTSVKTPALQAFHTRIERLNGVIYLHPNHPLPTSLLANLREMKPVVYYRCIIDLPLPSVLGDDMALFALLDHLIDSLDRLRFQIHQ